MVHQRNRWIHDQSGFIGYFDTPWPRQILDHCSWSRSLQRSLAFVTLVGDIILVVIMISALSRYQPSCIRKAGLSLLHLLPQFHPCFGCNIDRQWERSLERLSKEKDLCFCCQILTRWHQRRSSLWVWLDHHSPQWFLVGLWCERLRPNTLRRCHADLPHLWGAGFQFPRDPCRVDMLIREQEWLMITVWRHPRVIKWWAQGRIQEVRQENNMHYWAVYLSTKNNDLSKNCWSLPSLKGPDLQVYKSVHSWLHNEIGKVVKIPKSFRWISLWCALCSMSSDPGSKSVWGIFIFLCYCRVATVNIGKGEGKLDFIQGHSRSGSFVLCQQNF